MYTATYQMPDGTRRFFRADTRKEAEKKKEIFVEELQADSPLFRAYALKWLETYKAGTVSEVTYKTIEGILNRYLIPALGGKRLSCVTAADIVAMLRNCSGYSKSTQKKIVDYSRAIFRSAIEEGIIHRNPVVSTIRAGGSEPEEVEPLTSEQITELLNGAIGTKLFTFSCLCLYCGLRKSEALGLKWEDVDYENDRIFVRRAIVFPAGCKEGRISTGKTKAAAREIPMPHELTMHLYAESLCSKSEWIFSTRSGAHASQGSFDALWRGTMLRREIFVQVHPHQLRHTCITNWFKAGLSVKAVQCLAGHSSATVTMNIYNHYCREQRMEDCKKLISQKTEMSKIKPEKS